MGIKHIEKYDPRLFKGICHRGLHNEQFTENGLNAFRNAIDHGLTFELDIHLTKDGELLVCHDDDLVRTTGKSGIIEELTLAEIKENYRLLDGEEVPSFQEVLDLNQERVPIVVELKVHAKNYKPLAKKAVEVLRQIKDKKTITLISFDPRALLYARKSPFTKGLLVCEKRSDVFAVARFFDYLDVEDTLVTHKKTLVWRSKGMPINTWTIEKPEQLEKVKGKVDMITFQHLPIEDIQKAGE
ncbi:MAG: hypothetical protein K6F32_02790 [Bacilli bacterium]|nr:hypothetical protein [Bacilli bacterium]